MSSCTTTVPSSVRKSDPVGQTSRHAACVQCLQTSELINQRRGSPSSSAASPSSRSGARSSMNATCRHASGPSCSVLSYDLPDHSIPCWGMTFHSLQATSHALQPMQTEVSVKKPTRAFASAPYVSSALIRAASCLPHLRRLLTRRAARLRERLHAQAVDELDERRAARAAAGADVAGEGLHLLDVHVRVEDDRREVVGRVALR